MLAVPHEQWSPTFFTPRTGTLYDLALIKELLFKAAIKRVYIYIYIYIFCYLFFLRNQVPHEPRPGTESQLMQITEVAAVPFFNPNRNGENEIAYDRRAMISVCLETSPEIKMCKGFENSMLWLLNKRVGWMDEVYRAI